MLLYILVAILIFGVLIFVHELGHFLLAKSLGVQVNEFSICMGPALWQKQRGETTYSLRLIPVGGYCAMEGEDEKSDNPRAFTAVAPWRRLLILIAGSGFNFLCGLLVLLVLYSGVSAIATPTISGFHPDSTVAEDTGLQVGDTLYRIDGERVYLFSDVSLLMDRDTDGKMELTVLRNGKHVELGQVPLARKAYWEDGQQVLLYGLNFGYRELDLAGRLEATWNTALNFSRLVRLGLQDLITGNAGIKELSGPVGIVRIIAETGESSADAEDAVMNIAFLAAFLAVNLAIMNLLPLPALDGGRAFCLLLTWLIETILGRKIDPKYEKWVHTVGMILLMAFIAFISLKDIFQIFK